MKNKGLLLLIIFIVGISAIIYLSKVTGKTATEKAIIGLDAPDFELTDIEGKTWRLSDLKGKVVLVNFWATWCDTCKEEKPFVNSLLKGDITNHIVYLSILYNDEPSSAARFQQENNYNFPVLIDNKQVSAKYGITGIPETFIINKKGILSKKIIGGIHWNLIDVNNSIKSLISES